MLVVAMVVVVEVVVVLLKYMWAYCLSSWCIEDQTEQCPEEQFQRADATGDSSTEERSITSLICCMGNQDRRR